MELGQVIRALREEKGWTQEQLAFEADMTTSHLSRIERGQRRVPTTRLDALAGALGTSPAAILARQEGLTPPEGADSNDGDLTIDYTAEAVALRKVFRLLPLESRRLVVDFAHMLERKSLT